MSDIEWHRSVLFSCEYEFLPEGVRVIRERLDEELKKANLLASATYLEDVHVWIVVCYDEDSVNRIFEILHGIVSQIIMVEEERLEDEYQNAMYDDHGNQKLGTAPKLVQLPTHHAKPEETTHGAETSMPEHQDSRICNARLTWECGEAGMIHLIVPSEDQDLIATLTSCQLVQHLNEQKIYIASHTMANCQRAWQKLDNILQRYYHPHNPVVQHVFYSEDSRNYQVCARSLVNVKPQLLKNTLIKKEDLHPGYGKMHKASVLRFCDVDVSRSTSMLIDGKEIVPMSSMEIMHGGMTPWNQVTYPTDGDSSRNLMQGVSPYEVHELLRESALELEGISPTAIENWIQNVPENAADCDNLINTSHSTPNLVAQEALNSAFNLENFLNPSINFQRLLELDNNAKFVDSEVWEPMKSFVVPKKVGGEDKGGEETCFARLQGLELLSEIDARTYHNTMRQKAPKGGEQTCRQTKPKFNNEIRQAQENQQWAKPVKRNIVPAAPDPTAMFVEEMDTAIRPLIQNLRFWEGDTRLQAQLGRILIRNAAQYNPTSVQPSCWDPEELRKALNSGFEHGNTEVNMTKMITTMLPEAQHLLRMTDSYGVELWQHDPTGPVRPKISMSYEFKCQANSSNKIFVVKIDAKNLEVKVKSMPFEIGVVNVHCLSRNWDYRVVATVEQDLEEAYGQIGDAIASSLFIPKDVHSPCLWFQLGQHCDITFRAIRVIRNCRYLSKDGKSILTLKEIHDLKTNNREMPGKGLDLFIAWEPHIMYEIGGEPVWLEVSIESNVGLGIFSHNLVKPFGDVATWTEDLVMQSGVLPDTYLPACAMVKQMDNIGALNDNHWEPQTKDKSVMGPNSVSGYW